MLQFCLHPIDEKLLNHLCKNKQLYHHYLKLAMVHEVNQGAEVLLSHPSHLWARNPAMKYSGSTQKAWRPPISLFLQTTIFTE